MEERYIATVDLGTSKTALTVAKVNGKDIQVHYYREVPSSGIRYGGIINPSRESEPVKELVTDAEKQLGIRIHQVVAGLPRFGVVQEVSSAKVQRSDSSSCISQEEIDSIKSIALDNYPVDDTEKYEIYGSAAQSFSTDEIMNCPEEEIVGMPSSTIEGKYKVFVGPKRASSNIDVMLNMASLASARKYFLPGVTAEAILSTEEKENGVALVEVGGGVSSVTIYHGGLLRYFFSIPFGGNTITNDIKLECGFSGALAENIKLGFGACMSEKLQTMGDKVLQIMDDEDGSSQELRVKYLSEIISVRAAEIIDALLFKIQESGYADRLRSGVVLTGGCSALLNFAAMIKEMSGYNVKIGFPKMKHISVGEFSQLRDPSAAASVGMLSLAAKDAHLNCCLPSEKAAYEGANPLKSIEGSVFDTSDLPETDPEEKRSRGRRIPKKEPKGNSIVEWSKGIANGIVLKVGDLFENME